MRPVEKVINHIKAKDKVIYFCTNEEEELYRSVENSFSDDDTNVFTWDFASGLCGGSIYAFSAEPHDTIHNPVEALVYVNGRSEHLEKRSIYIFRDLHFFLNAEKQDLTTIGTIAELKKFVLMEQKEEKSTIVLISNKFVMPNELSQYVTLVESTYTDVDIDKAVEPFKDVYSKILDDNNNSKKWATIKSLLTGLTTAEIARILRNAENELSISESLAEEERSSETLSKKLEKYINDEKRKIIKASGVAELIEDETNIEDVGGLEELIAFLKRKQTILQRFSQAKDLKIKAPKGCLIVGMPGCGKSLTAKAAHTLFGYPLLQLDMGMILGKYVGESEKNLRDMLNLAEAISPCVLWVDELEKAFAGSDSNSQNSDVMRRMMGYFLTWLQEKKSKTFVIATANSVDSIPEELLRKGRFDKLFYVDYPNQSERESIFEKHMNKMGLQMQMIPSEKAIDEARSKKYKEEIDKFVAEYKQKKKIFDVTPKIKYSPSASGIGKKENKDVIFIMKDEKKEEEIRRDFQQKSIKKLCGSEMDMFSGAEIEGIIQDAAENAFYEKSKNLEGEIKSIEITEEAIQNIIKDMKKRTVDKNNHKQKIDHLIELGFVSASKSAKR